MRIFLKKSQKICKIICYERFCFEFFSKNSFNLHFSRVFNTAKRIASVKNIVKNIRRKVLFCYIAGNDRF